ncbi:DGQHR domain-containing protein [Paraburkholderia unamae]|uniref:DGQHR domain-containing protein n=1 Tax=Paraburkholderia unamae TaxID=219649 RepID=UPI001CC7A0AC|nr:DGQHR domain-containing protein [Paraburkholderia unamae]
MAAAAPLIQRKYYALENVQRPEVPDLKFYLFHAPAADILEWAAVERLSPKTPKGIQRSLNKTKIRKLEEYLEAPYPNTIATSVVVVFNKDAVAFSETKVDGKSVKGRGNLTVKWKGPKAQAATIVDGQHRVIGASNVGNGALNLNVVGIVGADPTEGAFQFLVINNNSSKVSPSHVKALFTDYKEEELFDRMLASGSTNVDEKKITALDYFDRGVDSPFKGEVKWAKNVDGFIVPNALEAGLSEVLNRTSLLMVEDIELETFTLIWLTIKEQWPHLWNSGSHLLEKACLQSLTAYLCDALEQMRLFSDTDVQYSDPDVLKGEVKKVLKRIDPSFFEVEWTTTGLDTRAGQQLLQSDLRQMASNLRSGRAWHIDLETVSIASLSEEKTKKGARPRKK